MKKILSMILAFAMIFTLTAPATAATVTGDTGKDVSGTFAPEIAITGISVDTGDNITYDAETNTYTVIIPANEVSVNMSLIFAGKNLGYLDENNTDLYFAEVEGGVKSTAPLGSLLAVTNATVADGKIVLTCTMDEAAEFSVMYSNDGENGTWYTGCNIVIKKAYGISAGTADNGSITVAESALPGDTVTVTPAANEGYRMTGLAVTYVDENDETQSVTVNADNTFVMPEGAVTVTPTFSKLYNINIDSTITNGTVTSNVAQAVEGEKVELFVHGNAATDTTPEYKLSNLTVTYTNADGETQEVTVADDHTFIMPAYDVTVTATFEKAQAYSVAIYDGITGGTVTPDYTTAAEGDDIVLTVTPNDGYRFESITVTDANGSTVAAHLVEGETDKYTFTMPASNVTVTATFEKIVAKITGLYITINGEKYDADNTSEAAPAIITPSSEVKVTVTGTDFAYLVEYEETMSYFTYFGENLSALCSNGNWWTIDTENNTATMTASHVVLGKATTAAELKYTNDRGANNIGSGVWVQYVIPTYAINIDTVENGSVTATVDGTAADKAEEGATVTLTLTPAEGYEVNTLVVTDANGNPVDCAMDSAIANTYTFTMPASAVTVTATFQVIQVTSATIAWGSLSYTYVDTVAEGETEEIGWTKDTTENAGKITVINTGDTDFTATAAYTKAEGYEEINGYFADNSATDSAVIKAGSSENSHTFTLTLSGKPEKAIAAGTKIGTVTITIEAVE